MDDPLDVRRVKQLQAKFSPYKKHRGGDRNVKRTLTYFFAVMAIALGVPYAANAVQPGDVQAQLTAQAAEIAELRELINGKVDNGTSKNTVNLNGRVHADYWGFPSSDDVIADLEGDPEGPQARIGFRRMRFGVKGDIAPNMNYKIEMEFAGGNKSEFRDAYLGWKNLPKIGKLQLGNQKRPYGLDHLNSSRYNVFLERPFVIESFNQDARRFGLVAYNGSEDQTYNWRYGVYNGQL